MGTKSLFDKISISSLISKNRFVRAAIGDKTVDGKITGDMLNNYRKLAEGGVGTIITGFTLVDEAEKNFHITALYNNDYIAGHKELVTTVHKTGAKIISQLVYCGSYVVGDHDGPVLAPSIVKHLKSGVTPREISLQEIKSIQVKFAEAALRAREAGYDGVEIHGAHGFLISQFLTPFYNHRTDSFGGVVANRSRMLLETCEAIRQAVGNNFSIWAKINVTDGIENGVSLNDCLYVSVELARRGLDAIEVSGNWMDLKETETIEAYYLTEAKAMAIESGLPIILTGGNRDFKNMTNILNSTDISVFGLARPFMKEPDLINRWQKEFGQNI